MFQWMKQLFLRVGRRHRTQSLFAASYLLVLIVPVLVYLGIDTQIKNMLISMAIEQQDTILKQTIREVDEDVLEIQRTALQVANDSMVLLFAYAGTELNPNEQASVPKLVKGLSQYYINFPAVVDFFIYFNKCNRIASRGGFYETDYYYQRNWSYPEWSVDQWEQNILQSETPIFYLPEMRIAQDRQVKSVITFHQSLTGKSRTKNTATLVLFLNTESIETKLNENPSHYASYIFDPTGQLVFSCGQAEDFPVEQLSLSPEEEWAVVDTASGKFLVSQGVSESTSWRYVSAVPYDVILGRVAWMNRYLLIGLLFIAAAGIPLIIVMARRAYSPIGRLVKTAMDLGFGRESDADSLDYVHRSLRSVHNENRSMRETYETYLEHKTKNQERVQDGILMQLVRGQLNHIDNLPDWLADMDMVFDHDCFQVVLVKLEDYSSFKQKSDAIDRNLALFAIRTAASEILLPIRSYSAVSGYDEVLLLLNIPTPIEEQQVVTLCEKIQQYLLEYTKIQISIAVGSPSHGLEQIYKSLESASNTIIYQLGKDSHSVLGYSHKAHPDDSPLRVQYKLEQKLISALKNGDYTLSCNLLDDILDDNESANGSINKARKLYITLINIAMKSMDERGINTDDIFGSSHDPIGGLMMCQSVGEMLPFIQDIFYHICEFIQGKQENRNTKLVDLAMNHLRDNYAQPGFGLASMAEQLGVSSEHLSRTIKMETGRNFVDILNQYRVEKAKEYIKSSDRKLSEIATLVGCGSVKTLIRIFKQYEGITPGKYK